MTVTMETRTIRQKTPSVDPPPARNGRTSAPTSHVTRAPHHVTRTASHVTNTAKRGRGASRPRPDVVVQKPLTVCMHVLLVLLSHYFLSTI